MVSFNVLSVFLLRSGELRFLVCNECRSQESNPKEAGSSY